MSTTTSRRTFLQTAAAAAPIAAIPVAVAAAATDPIFALIERRRELETKFFELCMQLDEAEADIEERCPYALIAWRKYSHIGGSGIDNAREEFLEQAVADPETIEWEYREAKEEYHALIREQDDWYQRHGLARLRGHKESMRQELRDVEAQLSETKPTTVAGAAAILAFAHEDLKEFGEEGVWSLVALTTIASALANM